MTRIRILRTLVVATTAIALGGIQTRATGQGFAQASDGAGKNRPTKDNPLRQPKSLAPRNDISAAKAGPPANVWRRVAPARFDEEIRQPKILRNKPAARKPEYNFLDSAERSATEPRPWTPESPSRPLAPKQGAQDHTVGSGSHPIAGLATKVGAESARLIAEAERLASRATTRDELARVIALCQQASGRIGGKSSPVAAIQLASWAANRRGELAAEQGDEESALADFGSAIRWNPVCWQAIHNRGVSNAIAGKRAAALSDFHRAIELNPRFAAAFRNRAELRMDLGAIEAAIEDYTAAIALMPDDGELRYLRADALHRIGRFVAAAHDFNKAIQLGNDNAATYTGRGNLYSETAYYELGLKDYRTALQIDERYAPAYRAAAWVLATCPDPHFRRPEKAVLAARRAVKLSDAPGPLEYDALAAALASAGQFDAAVVAAQRSIELAGRDSIAQVLQARLNLYQRSMAFVAAEPRAAQAVANTADDLPGGLSGRLVDPAVEPAAAVAHEPPIPPSPRRLRRFLTKREASRREIDLDNLE